MNELDLIKKIVKESKGKIVYHPDENLIEVVESYYSFTSKKKINEMSVKEIKIALLANSLTADFF